MLMMYCSRLKQQGGGVQGDQPAHHDPNDASQLYMNQIVHGSSGGLSNPAASLGGDHE